MNCESFFPPRYDREAGDKLLDVAGKIMQRCCSEACVIPYFIIDRKKACRMLDTAGCMYQCILTSVRLFQYRRALLYLCALERYCDENFSSKVGEKVSQQINDYFLNDHMFDQ